MSSQNEQRLQNHKLRFQSKIRYSLAQYAEKMIHESDETKSIGANDLAMSNRYVNHWFLSRLRHIIGKRDDPEIIPTLLLATVG